MKFWQRDSVKFGIWLGAIVPPLMYVLLSLIDYTILRVAVMNDVKVLRTNIVPDDTQFALSVAGNLFFFWQFLIRRHKDRTGRGILTVTFFYAILYVVLFLLYGVTEIKLF